MKLTDDFAMALDPVLMCHALGFDPDPIQAALMRSTSKRVLLNCTRQWGKTTTTAAVALNEALYRAPAMIILVSPSQHQSTELFKKITEFWKQLPGAPESTQIADQAATVQRVQDHQPTRQRAHYPRFQRRHPRCHGRSRKM